LQGEHSGAYIIDDDVLTSNLSGFGPNSDIGSHFAVTHKK